MILRANEFPRLGLLWYFAFSGSYKILCLIINVLRRDLQQFVFFLLLLQQVSFQMLHISVSMPFSSLCVS